MEIRLLGPVRAFAHGRKIHLGPRKQRFVLAVLALEVNQVVPVDRLVELMWPTTPPRTAIHAVRVCASRLRSVLDGAELIGSGGGYGLHTDPMAIDAHRFRSLAEQARDVDSDLERIELLTDALALWAGPPLGDSAPPDQRERLCRGLEEARLVAIEDRLAARLRLGHSRDVLDELTGLVAAHPIRERLIGQLMLALSLSGRPGDALGVYREARQRLADELGLDPGPELRQIELAILRGDAARHGAARHDAARHDAARHDAARHGAARHDAGQSPDCAFDCGPARTRSTDVPALLPRPAAGFAGREAQLTFLDSLVARPGTPGGPIAAITGTAGIGKTTLAVHWAHRVAHMFPDGQLYVNLRGFDEGPPMSSAEAVRIFLDALGAHPSRIPAGQQAQADLYRSLVNGRRMLVVLDNAAGVDQVRPLIPGAPACFVLITSRNDMAGLVAGEAAQVIGLDLLTRAEGRALLAWRVGEERVAAEPEAVDDMIDLSARLPLALAIVAARAVIRPEFPLSALAAQLRAGRALDPFDIGDRSADVRTVFSWSYRTLSDEAARLFRLLGLHPGPDLEISAAASLAGMPVHRTLSLLRELARAHLLTEPVPGRYACHALLAGYASELCHSADDERHRDSARRRLLDHYLHSAAAAAAKLDEYREPVPLAEPAAAVVVHSPANHDQALSWLNDEYPVLLAVAHLAAAENFDAYVWRLAGVLGDFFDRRGYWQDWADILQLAHAAARRLDEPRALALTYRGLGRVHEWLGRHDDAWSLLGSALEIFTALEDRIGMARTCHSLGRVAELRGDQAEALRLTRRGLELFEVAGHRAGTAKALNGVGWYHALLGDHREALAYCARALTIVQELGDRRVEANTWDSLGYIHHHLGDPQRAIECYRQAIAVVRLIGDRFHEAEMSVHLGDAYELAGDPRSARQAWRHALTVLEQLGHPDAIQVRSRLDHHDDERMMTGL
ncbi:MAG TPA: BTAD domain-containing putative transcriptional regulator [Micromonosporaceae bacterium]